MLGRNYDIFLSINTEELFLFICCEEEKFLNGVCFWRFVTQRLCYKNI